jgi:class 3 adenylate cyclase
MIFVNTVAKLVHGISCEFLGSPDKNIGDAFLLIWKFPESEIDYHPDLKEK